ncbi:MAG: gamma-glutamylcyclotransferase, partial [Deltaproteobacteria bacterium]
MKRGERTRPFFVIGRVTDHPFPLCLSVRSATILCSAMTAEVDLFVYGTLMSESCLYALTERYFPRREAKLSGFERIVPSTGYPYIIPKAGAWVQGLLLLGVDLIALAALDQYESEGVLYHRRRVEV